MLLSGTVMMDKTPAPLVRTPPDRKWESPFGYLVRLSESNGYESPYFMLRHAGITHDEMFKPAIDHQRLSMLVARSPDAVSHLRYVPVGEPLGTALQINGQRVPNGAVHWQKSTFCPLCVTESGYHDIAWDFRYLTACPRHRCRLLDRCDVCGKRISWCRPGLLVCRCGADLSQQHTLPADDKEADLADLLTAKLHLQPLPRTPSVFPVDSIAKMSLHTFVRVTIHLAQQARLSKNLDRTHDPRQQLLHTAELLIDWPVNFFAMLKRMGDQREIKALGLRGQFSSFCNSMFRSVLPQSEVLFIKRAFVEFGLNHWGKGFVHDQWIKGVGADPNQGRYFAESQLARHSGVVPSLLRKIRKCGLIEHAVIETTGTRVVVVDATALDDAARSAQSLWGQRRSAEFLGFPEPILGHLRRAQIFEARRTHRADNMYRMDDVLIFHRRLLESCPLVPPEMKPSGFRSLKSILFKKCTPAPIRVEVLAALLRGDLTATVRSGSTTDDIWIDPHALDDLRDTCARPGKDGLLSTWQAAAIIRCNAFSVRSLAEAGQFDMIVSTGAGVRFIEQSIRAFAAQFVPLVSVAKLSGISARSIRASLAISTTETVVARRHDGEPVQTFIRVHDVDRLLCSARRRPTRQRHGARST